MRKLLNGAVALSFAMFASCGSGNDRSVIATIDGQPVYANVVDKAVEKDVYESLCNIYDARLNATRELIGIKLLHEEAQKRHTSEDNLIEMFRRSHAADSMTTEQARARLTDSIAASHDIEINLRPPVAPAIRTDSALAHSRGCEGAKVVITIISDFDCGMCQTMHRAYEDLFREFSSKAEFRHICFSDSVRPSTLAAEAAAAQASYWAMHDTLMRFHDEVDDITAERLASGLGLDMEHFTHAYYSQETATAVFSSFTYLSAKGVERTPLVLINRHPVRFSHDKALIAKEIERALNE